jgi:opacity protein-like surface antigen
MKNTFLFVRACLLVFLLLLCQTGLAAIVPVGPQVTGYGGVSYSYGYTDTSRVIPNEYIDNEVDTRTANNNDANFMPGIGIAYDFLTGAAENNNFIHDFSVGLDWFYLNTSLKGQVYLYGDPDLNYYNYKLNFNSNRVMIDAQLNFRAIKKVTPFIQVGYGLARIQDSYSDEVSSSAPSYVPNPGYAMLSKTNYNPAYTLGAGIQVPVSEHVTFSVRYLFTDLGSVETGGGVISNGSLVTPIKARLRTQAGLAGLTFTFA